MKIDYATQAGLVTPLLSRRQSPAQPIRPVINIDRHTELAREQHTHNAISVASWHLRHGRVDQANRRILAAARTLTQPSTSARA